jgi:hypothetical protein
MPSRVKEGIPCIAECSKFRVSKCQGYPNGYCRTFVEPPLAIMVHCRLTIFIVIFANGLDPRTDFACWNAVPAADGAVPGTSECS